MTDIASPDELVFTKDGSELIGRMWQVNIAGESAKRWAWTATDGRKSTTFHKNREDSEESLRDYHAHFVSKNRAASRCSMDQTLMRMAKLMADRATCSRAQVGAVIVLETRPLSSGYNGTAAGLPHCDHACNCTFLPTGPKTEHWAMCQSLQPCRFSVHAEANAIAFAAKHGVNTNGATIYTTMAPCLECAKLIVNAGIVRVVAAAQYRDDSGTRLLLQCGIQVHAELL